MMTRFHCHPSRHGLYRWAGVKKNQNRIGISHASHAGSEVEASGRCYLAQHPLFEQIPELRADLIEPEYCALGEGEVKSVNAWFGPPATVRLPPPMAPKHSDTHLTLMQSSHHFRNRGVSRDRVNGV